MEGNQGIFMFIFLGPEHYSPAVLEPGAFIKL
jgi:hypothetical protein